MITAERLRELLDYNPDTGAFTWRIAPSFRVKVGGMAGVLRPDNRMEIKADKRHYYAHRLAWFYMFGEWPKHEIDHIDGNPSNNQIVNLRDVPMIVNRQNKRQAHRNNKVGMLGVKKHGERFSATIKVNGQATHIGYFSTPELAHAAYVNAKRVRHEGCTI